MRELVVQPEITASEEELRRQRFPVGAAITFDDLVEHGRMPALHALRDSEPISWVPALGGWLVTGYELARDMLSRSTDFTVWAEPNLVRASLGVMMLTSDGSEHRRQREPFDPPFRMRNVRAAFEAPVRRRADELLDQIAPLGACELAESFAAPFAIGVAGDILGLSLGDVAQIRGFYDAFAGAMVYDGDPEPQRQADTAREALNAILQAELDRVRRSPDDSITSAVARHPAGLSDEEVIAQLRVVLFGAIETVEAMVLSGVSMLLSHPGELAVVRADPAILPNAIEEAMRLVTPVAFVERWAARDTALGGIALGAGEFVGISTLAASRDPAVFDDPDCFDVPRANARRHLSFSFGEHHCLGFNMARMQGPIAVAALIDRLPGLTLESMDEPTGFAFRKSAAVHVSWA
jgi:cytochrome P450